MTQLNSSNESESTSSLWSAIVEVIRGLKGQPVLLFGFGLAVLVLAAGTLAIDNLRVVAGTLLVLVIVVMAVWITLKALALKSNKGVQSSTLSGGSVNVGQGVKMSDNQFKGGDVESRMDEMSGSAQGGNITIGKNSELKHNKISGGNVKR